MANYYFDLETTGLDPKKDKIIALQFQELDRNTGEPIGKLVILKEWESTEEKILNEFVLQSKINDPYPFGFVPIGNNFTFKDQFLATRMEQYSIPAFRLLSRPFIDLRAFAIIMNRGEFKGSGIDKITGLIDGKEVPQWYHQKEYAKIENYIKDKTHEFVKLTAWLYREMPPFLERYQEQNRIK